MAVVDDYLARAAQRFNAGAFDEARSLCQTALSLAPKSTLAFEILGTIELQRKDFDQATKHFASAVKLFPQSAALLYKLAQAQRSAGRLNDAISSLKKVCAQEQQAEMPHRMLAAFQAEAGNSDAAISTLAGFLKRHGGSVDARTQLCSLYAAVNRLEDMLACAEGAVAAAPQNAVAHYTKGDALLVLHRPQEAEAAYRAGFESPQQVSPERAEVARSMRQDAVLMAALDEQLSFERISQGPDADRLRAARATWNASAVAAIRDQLDDITSTAGTAVFFHAAAGKSHPFLATATSNQSIDYAHTLTLACKRIHQVAPEMNTVILCDDSVPADIGGKIVRVQTDSDKLMYSRMSAYHALVASKRIQSPVLFLDTDVILNRDFAQVLDGTFDVGLTDRSVFSSLMPVNEGMILGARGDSDQLLGFFADCLTIYDWLAEFAPVRERYGFDVRHWRGGQLSLAAYVGWKAPPLGPRDMTVRDTRVRFFPTTEFNYSVKRGDTRELLSKKWAVHFKGAEAKAQMASYVNG